MSGLTCQKQLGAATAKEPSLVASLVCRLSGLRQFPSRQCRTYRALLAPRSRTLRYRSGGALRALALQVLQNPPVHSGALPGWVQIALKPASKGLGLHGVFIRGEGLMSVVADSAFKRMQVDTRAC